MAWKCPSCSLEETNAFYVCGVCGLEWCIANPDPDPVTSYPNPYNCPDALEVDGGGDPGGCGNETQPSYAVCQKCKAVTYFA